MLINPNPETGALAKSKDTDECSISSGSALFAEIKTIFRILKKSICDPLKYTMDSPILILSICMGKFIRIQRVYLLNIADSDASTAQKVPGYDMKEDDLGLDDEEEMKILTEMKALEDQMREMHDEIDDLI